jgi:hypothetical protein
MRLGCRTANGSKVRIAVIGLAKMLRSITNVRFGEAAAPQLSRTGHQPKRGGPFANSK